MKEPKKEKKIKNERTKERKKDTEREIKKRKNERTKERKKDKEREKKEN